MLQRKNAIERDLIDLVKGKKTSAEAKSSLQALQNILTPKIDPGIGLVNGRLAAAPGHCIEFGPGVVGPTAEYAGYNEEGEFFSSPVEAREFSGIRFNDGCNIVIISEDDAKMKLRKSCKEKVAGLSQLKRAL